MLSRIKRKSRTRIGIAWLLLLTLMPFYVVKSVHHHELTVQSAGHQNNDDDQSSCPICHFTLSPFIQTKTVSTIFIAVLVPFEPAVYESKGLFDISYSHSLRAPPVTA